MSYREHSPSRSQSLSPRRASTKKRPRFRRPHPPTASPSEPYFDLAAAKRGGRGRGRSTGRGRARPRSEGDRPAAPNGLATPAVSFSLPSASGPTSDDVRRVELLRRLNQITQQRCRLERRVSRENAKDHVAANGDAHATDSHDPAIDGDLQVLAGVSKTDAVADPRHLNGARKPGTALPKRRRGEAVAQSDGSERRSLMQKDAPRLHDYAAGAADPGQRNGRHSAHKRVQAVPGKDGSMRLELDGVSRPPNVSKLDVMTVEGKRTPAGTPPTTPGIIARGSGRVRTPSVLLKSHPGEKVPPLAPNAASKNRQVAYCLRMVKDMVRLKDAMGFSKPIDQLWSVDQLPGYFEMITSPMDLETVRKRLESGHYLTSPGKAEVEEVTFDADAFASDMRLIFNNARTYNRKGDQFYESATRLLEKFEAKMAQMPSIEQLAALSAKKNKKRRKGQPSHAVAEEKKVDGAKRRKSTDGEGTSHKRRPSGKKKVSAAGGGKARTPAASGSRKKTGGKSAIAPAKDVNSMNAEELEARLRALERRRALTQPGSPAASPSTGQPSYLAEAQALYHVEVTFEEKVQLIKDVDKLPAEKLRKVISISNKASTAMEVNMNEEVELDIESMDNNTIRDIQALVNQHFRNKKGLLATGPNGDVNQMQHAEVLAEIEKVRVVLRKHGRGKSDDGNGNEKEKNEKSFYDSDSSSDSDDSDGSGSDDDSSSGDSDSSGDESGSDFMRKMQERNLAHQQAMQAAGTPLPSPPYRNDGGNG